MYLDVTRSEFKNCDFREATLRESHFIESRLTKCLLARSSVTLMHFTNCAFERMGFADCTAMFLIFSTCAFNSCSINAETVGYTYGLTAGNLDSMRLVHLGKREAKPANTNVVDALIATYWARNWYVGACILQLNFRRGDPFSIIQELNDALQQTILSEMPMDWDELRFLVEVLERLNAEERLPLLALWRCIDTLQRSSRKSGPMSSAADLGQSVIAQADRLLLGMLDITATVVPNQVAAAEFLLELKLTERPETPLNDIVPQGALEAFGASRMELIHSAAGSWIEIWQISLAALIAVRVTLVAANGVLKEFSKVIENARLFVEKLTRKRKKAAPAKPHHARATKRQSAKQSPLPVIVEQQMVDIREKTAAVSLDDFAKLEKALRAVSKLSGEQLKCFAAYDSDHVIAATVQSVGRAPRRRGRAHQPAA